MSAVQTSRCREAAPRQSPRLARRRPTITLANAYDPGDGAIKSSVDDFRQALDIIGDAVVGRLNHAFPALADEIETVIPAGDDAADP